MCVINLSKANQPIPTKDQFKRMWDRNPDGAGIILDLGNGQVMYKKGLMTFNEFMDAVDEIQSEHNLVESACAFHFRIKTSGKVDAPTTHPFLLSPRYQDLRKLEYRGNMPVMMHNGTIPKFGGWLDALSSDTQDFAATIGYTMLRKNKRGKKPSKTMLKAAEATIGASRVVVFYGDNDPVAIGDWKESEGLCVSNTLWSNSTTTTSTASTTPRYNGGTVSTYTAPSPDQFGMFKDVYPSNERQWVQYSTQQEMNRHTSYLQRVIKDGEEFLRNTYYFNGASKPIMYKVDGLEIYTETGDIARQARDAYFDNLMDETTQGIDEEDYITAEEPEDFWNKLCKYDFNRTTGEYTNVRGETLYVDFTSNEAYTEKALRAVFGKTARYAKRDLQINGALTADWRNPSEEEKRDLQHQIRALNEKEKQLKLLDAEAAKALSC